MGRIGFTVVALTLCVCGAVAAMVAFLSMYASHALWLVLPVAGILAGMGAFLGFATWRAAKPRTGE